MKNISWIKTANAWRRLWVRAIIFLPQGRGEPHLILQLSRKAQDDEPLKQVKASRDGLRLFRCRSGSRALRCWGVASGSTLLIYLAAATEQLTQEWMHTLREGLWPTVSTNHDCYYEVSLIDDEKSFSSGLLGVYGRLVKTSDLTLSLVHPHWQGTQMRWRLSDILDVRIIRRVEDEDSDSGVFSLTVQSGPNNDTRVLQFYSSIAFKTVDWLKSILPNVKDEIKSKAINNSEPISQSESKLEKTNLLIPVETTPNYATVQKTKVNIHSEDVTRPDDGSVATGTLSNIPESFLNASASSLMLEQLGNRPDEAADEESDDSSTDSFDHIYEDLESGKDRSYTVYEKVDDEDDVYVPHAPSPPPTLPVRIENRTDLKQIADESTVMHFSDQTTQNNTIPEQNPLHINNLPAAELRLQKLRESVSEALKQAEEPPTPTPETPKRPSFLRKMVGKSKSKSNHASPPLEQSPSPIQANDTTNMKRTVSESDLMDAKLEESDLPLRPFDHQNSAISQRQPKNEVKKQNHVPLEDLLKNMQMGDRQRHLCHRRGVSEGGKIVYEIDQHTKYLQVRSQTEKSILTPAQSSDQLEDEEYIDMT